MMNIDNILPLNIETYDLKSKKAGLVVIDVLKGFCETGAGNLAPSKKSQQMDEMLKEVNSLSSQFVEKEMPVFAFIDSHLPEIAEPPYPTHCIKGTAEVELMDEIAWFYDHPLVTCFEKDCINSYIGAIDPKTRINYFEEWIKDNHLETLIFVGVCTDICIVDCVVTTLSVRNHSLLSALKDIVVYLPACATYDMTSQHLKKTALPEHMNHPQGLMHHIGAKIMAFRGAILSDKIQF